MLNLAKGWKAIFIPSLGPMIMSFCKLIDDLQKLGMTSELKVKMLLMQKKVELVKLTLLAFLAT